MRRLAVVLALLLLGTACTGSPSNPAGSNSAGSNSAGSNAGEPSAPASSSSGSGGLTATSGSSSQPGTATSPSGSVSGVVPAPPEDWHYPSLVARQADDIAAAVQQAIDEAVAGKRLVVDALHMVTNANKVFMARAMIARTRKAPLAPDTQVVQRRLIPRAGPWPRWFVTAGSASLSPTVALRLFVAPSPDRHYALWGQLDLLPGAVLPEPAEAALGAPLVAADATGWLLSPLAAASGYTDVLNQGAKASTAGAFADDPLRQQLALRQKRDAAALAASKGSALSSTHTLDPASVRALQLADGSILVFAAITQTYRVTVGAVPLTADENAIALSGQSVFTRSLERTALETVALVVPAEGSAAKVKLLAASKADIRVTGS